MRTDDISLATSGECRIMRMRISKIGSTVSGMRTTSKRYLEINRRLRTSKKRLYKCEGEIPEARKEFHFKHGFHQILLSEFEVLFSEATGDGCC